MTDASTAALVAYLRCEADVSEMKAKRLRQQADALALEHGEQHFLVVDPSDMAPLDEFGVPKYKGAGRECFLKCGCMLLALCSHFNILLGKKRGRKPKPRQRQHNPHRKKRAHTAYTLFVQVRACPSLSIEWL
jgi:hypothetical protein